MDMDELDKLIKAEREAEQKNKTKALKKIVDAFRATSRGADELLDAVYDTEREDVTFTYATMGKRMISVWADSELAFIEDCTKHLLKMLY